MLSKTESNWQQLVCEERTKIDWLGRQVHMVCPSIVVTGEPFRLRISVVGADHLPVSSPISVTLLGSDSWVGIPHGIEVPQEGASIEPVRIEKPGAYYLQARIEGAPGQAIAYSNPVWVMDNPHSRLYWGDIHVHTIHGQCQPYAAKSPQFAMFYARDVTFLDFAALTDHNDRLDSDKWAEQKSLVQQMDQPGVFVPFLGFESSHCSECGGDNNVYFREAGGDFFPRGDTEDIPLEDLWGFLEACGHDFMTIPHHTGRHAKYRSWRQRRYNPSRENLFEIYSMWGSSEAASSRYSLWGGNTDEKAYFEDALKSGCRFGAIASSDDHTSLPGSESSLRLPGRAVYSSYCHHGLMGVFSNELDRNSLWQAMCARGTVASTYGRPILLLDMDGYPAGAEVEAGSDRQLGLARHLRIRYLPPFPERPGFQVTVFRNGEPMADERRRFYEPYELQCVEFVDELAFDAAVIRGARFCERPFVVYHVRVEGDLGDTVWSSPIWLVE